MDTYCEDASKGVPQSDVIGKEFANLVLLIIRQLHNPAYTLHTQNIEQMGGSNGTK
jgi:hypothetical protein